jgi:hypothetical protein
VQQICAFNSVDMKIRHITVDPGIFHSTDTTSDADRPVRLDHCLSQCVQVKLDAPHAAVRGPQAQAWLICLVASADEPGCASRNHLRHVVAR